VLNDLEVNNITDLDDALDVIRKLLNLVEALRQENLELKRQNDGVFSASLCNRIIFAESEVEFYTDKAAIAAV